MANSGEVDKLFNAYGNFVSSTSDKIMKLAENRFYLASSTQNQVGFKFAVIDVSKARCDDFSNWLHTLTNDM
ncbi:hypothetical protein [Psychrosphaera algicola]|uniref:Uncharacterized protein n=1 Tax=Psychrosphaera algicola TaxID=3023714 RepID=A0ABT5FIN9_9GAMM|nr:hypothetical protein [Psychrosphaera sp. G1-22]MDC2891025.1 hypothetical protein [Psychrosphaera sp. G1-22]